VQYAKPLVRAKLVEIAAKMTESVDDAKDPVQVAAKLPRASHPQALGRADLCTAPRPRA
jgi:hypothetical protein